MQIQRPGYACGKRRSQLGRGARETRGPLEAKLYDPAGGGVGVKEMSRLRYRATWSGHAMPQSADAPVNTTMAIDSPARVNRTRSEVRMRTPAT